MDTQLTQQKLLGKENYIDIWLSVRKYKQKGKQMKIKSEKGGKEKKGNGRGKESWH